MRIFRFPLFFWVLASDAMGVAQAKRLFPLLASWGLVGKLLGLAIAAAAPVLLLRFGIDLGHLLLLNIAVYLLSFALLRRLRRHLDVKPLRRTAEGFRAALSGGIEFVREPAGAQSNYWLNAIVLGSREERDAFLEYSNGQGIMTRPLWKLMVDLPMFSDCQHDGLAMSRWLEERVVCLPSSVP